MTMLAATLASFPLLAQSEVFSLDTCRRMVLEQNKKVKAAQLEVEAAQSASEGARLNNRPALDGSVMGIYVGKPLDKLLPPLIGSASVSASQPIYTGGKIKLGVKASDKAVEIARGQKAMTEVDLLLAVETAYWQLVQAKEKVVLTQKYKLMLARLRDDLKNAVDAGLTYKNDQLRAEVSLNEAELNESRATDGVKLARLALSQLIGLPTGQDFDVADSTGADFHKVVAAPLDLVADKRPEIMVLQNVIEAQQIQTQIIKADLLPQIGVSAGAFGSAGKKVNFSNNNNFLASYYGMVSISVPIFDWGKNAKKVKEQNLRIQARQQDLEDTKEQIGIQVQAAMMQLNESVQKISLSNLSLRQAEENLRLAEDRYKAGTITGKDVLEAQAIWQQAYSNTIDAKIEFKINTAGYKKAIGELK